MPRKPKLTPETMDAIALEKGRLSTKELTIKYGLSRTTVQRICQAFRCASSGDIEKLKYIYNRDRNMALWAVQYLPESKRTEFMFSGKDVIVINAKDEDDIEYQDNPQTAGLLEAAYYNLIWLNGYVSSFKSMEADISSEAIRNVLYTIKAIENNIKPLLTK